MESTLKRMILVVVALLPIACSNGNRCESTNDCTKGWVCDSEWSICVLPCSSNAGCAEYERTRGECCQASCRAKADGGQTICGCSGCD